MNEGWEGAWQTRYWIAFSSSPAVHAAFSPLPCGHVWWCVCDVHLNMAADAWCSLKAAATTDFVYRIYNQTADVYKLSGKIVCVCVCVCKSKGNLCSVASLKKTNENGKPIWIKYRQHLNFLQQIHFTNYTDISKKDSSCFWWEIAITRAGTIWPSMSVRLHSLYQALLVYF